MLKLQKHAGFTLIELLIVIVVIAILAAISVVAYSGMQSRARDSIREKDINTIAKALEMYYIDHGEFPSSRCGAAGAPACPSPKLTNAQWSYTADGSWGVLEDALVPEYISSLPKPVGKDDEAVIDSSGKGYGYAYIAYRVTDCIASDTQTYRLYYRLEASGPKRDIDGTCEDGSTRPPTTYNSTSYYAVYK